MMFESKGHSSVAALCCQFHSMSYEPHLSTHTWITNVEDLAHCLKSSNSPMIPINIINTMICQLPDSYSLLIVHFDTMLQDLNASSDLNTIQYVIMRLINEEVCQQESQTNSGHMALVANSRTHSKKPTSITCFNYENSAHHKNKSTLSPY